MKTLFGLVLIGACALCGASLTSANGLTPCSIQVGTRSVPGYVNSDGKCIPRPENRPQEGALSATAQCRDGSYSYSQHQSGTCSHHGGVATWLR